MSDVKAVEKKLRANIEAMFLEGYYLNDGSRIDVIDFAGRLVRSGTCILGAATFHQWRRDPTKIRSYTREEDAGRALGCTDNEASLIECGYWGINHRSDVDHYTPARKRFYMLGTRLKREFYCGEPE